MASFIKLYDLWAHDGALEIDGPERCLDVYAWLPRSLDKCYCAQ